MTAHDHDHGPSRRKVLECMTWAGTGVLWTVAGGVPRSLGLIDEAHGRRSQGLHLPADQRQPHGLRQARQSQRQGHAGRGDRPGQGAAGEARLHDPHRRHHASVEGRRSSTTPRRSSRRPSSTCITCRASTTSSTRRCKLYRERYGRGTKGAGWYSVRRQRRAFHRPGQRRRPQGRRHGQSRRRAARMAGGRSQGPLGIDSRSWCSPTSRCGRSIRNWGWGTEDGARALGYAQALRLGHRAQRPHPPGDAEGRRQRHLPHRALDRLPAAGAGHRAVARADEGADDKLRRMLGIASVTFKQNEQRLAIIDTPLQG